MPRLTALLLCAWLASSSALIVPPMLKRMLEPLGEPVPLSWRRSAEKRAVPMSDDVFGLPLSPEDFAAAADIPDDVPQSGPGAEDPIELAGLFEGDISHMESTKVLLDGDVAFDGDDMFVRNAIREEGSLWPDSEIPYLISSSYTQRERAIIAKAVAAFEKNTCIRIVPRTTQKDYIHVRKGSGCSSAVGVVGGVQELSLADGCVYPGVVMHEFMHAAGFWHEQSRPDRGDHVIINWGNIISGMDYNFHKYEWTKIQSLDEPYDVTSIMHYGPYAFAANRKLRTITPIKPTDQMGQRNGFSEIDIKKLNKLYKCQGTGGGAVGPTKAPEPSACQDNNEYCSEWSARGECTKNPTWMNVHCAKSCGTCKACADHNTYCLSWAKSGECANNWSYMSIYCRDSCGLCLGSDFAHCADKNKYCADWAEIGECTNNPDFMLQDCKKACGAC
ncbi:zinc metalloproteinase nas-4-like [Amphibalanus amphitrite]|uniref:zinc metalloproteinase nas-4-like n=1 Tax=Amphibalanus amphitrite TaxID=1232801 RepID=UPI001C903D95|nr:zinc metalloproteinase nas-4-like [Amphibalanus amphitrite]